VAPTEVRPYDPERDRSWAEAVLVEHLGGARQIRRGEAMEVLDHLGLVAERDGERVGYLAYVPGDDEWEILAIAALERYAGTGTALVEAVCERAGAAPVWLVTTNDNIDALRFYQRRGFRLRALRPGAVDETRRRHKPELPPTGEHGIPIRDELELVRP
jgi:ribosomal protein S18 acetylase RimI-like enzyme